MLIHFLTVFLTNKALLCIKYLKIDYFLVEKIYLNSEDFRYQQ